MSSFRLIGPAIAELWQMGLYRHCVSRQAIQTWSGWYPDDTGWYMAAGLMIHGGWPDDQSPTIYHSNQYHSGVIWKHAVSKKHNRFRERSMCLYGRSLTPYGHSLTLYGRSLTLYGHSLTLYGRSLTLYVDSLTLMDVLWSFITARMSLDITHTLSAQSPSAFWISPPASVTRR